MVIPKFPFGFLSMANLKQGLLQHERECGKKGSHLQENVWANDIILITKDFQAIE